MIHLPRILILFLILGEWSRASVPVEFEEKSLSFYAGEQGEAYRVVVVPFGECPLLVRVVFNGKNYQLTAKQLSGEGFYYMGTLVASWQATISADRWRTFLKYADSASFWKKQSRVKELPILDGASYWIEGYKKSRSLSLERHCVGSLPEDKKLEVMVAYFLKYSREKAILLRSPYYSGPISTSEDKAIVITPPGHYRSKP